MSYTATTVFDDDIILQGAKLYAKAPTVFGEMFLKRIEPLQFVALQRVQTDPGPVKRPIRWASDRQRRWWFASKGGGKGIPYKRTGKLSAGWHWVNNFADGAFETRLENPSPITDYVMGIKQQPFHADTGWVRADEVGIRTSIALQDVAISTWVEATDILTLLEAR